MLVGVPLSQITDIICGMISILPSKYVDQYHACQDEENFTKEDYCGGDFEPKIFWVTQVLLITLEKNYANFNPPTREMKFHLKPLIITARVEGIKVNKILIDKGAAINILSITMLKRFEKLVEDLIPHNDLASDYSGKASWS